MHVRWTMLCGIGALGVVITLVAASQEVRGEPSDPSQPPSDVTPEPDPFEPYPLGPGAIPYEQLGAAERTAVDQIQETVETGQQPSSYAVFARATAQTRARAEADLATRELGLEGADEDGVVP
jgi:hypothetical protein